MNSRNTLFLLVLVGIVGGFVVWDHFKGVPTEDVQSKGKRLVAIDAKAVTHVELIRSNQLIVLEKNADNWDIKKPLAVRADYSAVSSILDELEFAERSRTLTEKDLLGVNLADFGLTPPHATIKLQGKAGMTELQIGNETPTKDALYVKVEGKAPVYVVRKSGFDRSNQTLEQLRSRAAIEFSPSATTRIEIGPTGRSIELTKSNVWVLLRPLASRADQSKISEMLTGLENLRIIDFVSEKPEEVHTYHLDEPDHEVTVYTGNVGKTLLLSKPLTNDATKVYAKVKNADSIFTVATESAKKFGVQINDLRDARVLSFIAPDVKAVEIARGAEKISLQRGEKGWQLTGPVSVAADDAAVRQFLDNLAGWRVKQFAADVATDLEKFGLATPALTLSLTGATTLQVGAVDVTNGVYFVKRADEPFIYGVDTNAIGQVPTGYGALRSRVIFDIHPAQISKLTVGEVILARDEQGKWKLVVPAQGILDTEAADAVAGVVAGLRAESFGRPKTEADQALPSVIKFTAMSVTHWLANAPDGQAAADTSELTFRLSAPMIETLSKKLVSEKP